MHAEHEQDNIWFLENIQQKQQYYFLKSSGMNNVPVTWVMVGIDSEFAPPQFMTIWNSMFLRTT